MYYCGLRFYLSQGNFRQRLSFCYALAFRPGFVGGKFVFQGICRIRLDEKDTREVLKHAKLPVLMIHGLADDFVPSYMTQQGYDACNGSKELLLVDGAGHGVSFLVDREAYVTRVIAFLEKYLEGF